MRRYWSFLIVVVAVCTYMYIALPSRSSINELFIPGVPPPPGYIANEAGPDYNPGASTRAGLPGDI